MNKARIQQILAASFKDIYSKTSTPANFNFYKKLGFEEINTFDDLGFTIKCYRWKV